MYDIGIIGGGPAALSAAVSARQRNKSVCIFGRSLDSSLLFAAEKVDNYLGLPDLSGEELLNQFYAHARKQGVEFVESRIKQIMPMGEYFVINADNNFVQAKTLILATGINKSRGIAGETEYLGKGVSYCATCDGMLYRGKNVVVVGENAEGGRGKLPCGCLRARDVSAFVSAGDVFKGKHPFKGRKTAGGAWREWQGFRAGGGGRSDSL